MNKAFEKILEKLKDAGGCDADCEYDKGWDSAIEEAISIVHRVAQEYNNGWIPCSERLPEQPKENPVFENKQVELYLASIKNADYSFIVIWNGKYFTDGFSKVEVVAWQPLPEPYKESEG